MKTAEIAFTIVSSKANSELHKQLVPHKEKEIEIDGIKFRPGYVVLDASEGIGEIWVWGIEIAKGIATIIIYRAFKKFIMPKILENENVVRFAIGGKSVEKKKEEIEKVFLEAIEKLERANNDKDEKAL